MLEVGKLYTCEKFHLLLYPDPDIAAVAAGSGGGPAPAAPNGGNPATYATFWSNRLGKPVFYLEKNIPLLILKAEVKAEEKFYEVLAGDRKGWIIYRDWLPLKEIDYV